MFEGILLLVHPAIAVITMGLIVWLIVSVKCQNINEQRVKKLSLAIALLMITIWIVAGYWYVVFYSADKAVIVKSSWSFAHKFFMETKEHIFFVVLILSLYLPIISFRNSVAKNKTAQKLIFSIGILLLSLMLYMDGSGAIISHGAEIAYMHKDGLL